MSTVGPGISYNENRWSPDALMEGVDHGQQQLQGTLPPP